MDKKFKTIVLIDDDPIINHVNKRLIQLNNLADETITFEGGQEALNFLKESIALPDLIFLDIQMPVMNGFEFLKEYDKIKKIFKEKTRLIVLSSTELEEELKKIEEDKNVYCFMSKPLNIQQLHSLTLD